MVGIASHIGSAGEGTERSALVLAALVGHPVLLEHAAVITLFVDFLYLESVTVDKDYPDATADTSLTLTFTTESGYTASFTTLGLEEAPITLLSADAMTGATPISFSIPQ